MPHSLSQIKTLLARAGVRPRHRWGQNFLIDLNLMRFLVESADIHADDVILEVGHGTGSMTQLLAERARGVVAVDIDPIMADIATAELAECANVTLIHGDVLANKHTLNPAVIDAVAHAADGAGGTVRSVKLVANLPYQIAAPLMMNLLIGPPAIDAMAVTIQREMADRMTAAPGTGDYGPLAIMLQAAGSVARIRTLPASAFWPAPKVTSAMVLWRRDPDALVRTESQIRSLAALVHGLFQSRRKTIRKTLTGFAHLAASGNRCGFSLAGHCPVQPRRGPRCVRIGAAEPIDPAETSVNRCGPMPDIPS